MDYTYTIHYEICDNVLENIRQGDDMHEVNIEPFLGEDRRVKLAIVRKLDKDGYIHRVNPQTDPFKISITVEGRQFWIDGGYRANFKELKEKQQLEKELLQTNISTNKFVQKNNRKQTVISVIVSIFIILSACFQGGTYYLEYRKEQSQKKEKQQTEVVIQNLLNRVKILESKGSQKNNVLDSIKRIDYLKPLKHPHFNKPSR